MEEPQMSTSTEESADQQDPSHEDLREKLRELRSELTRLRAQQAKEKTQSWIQRHPLLASALSVGIGAAAGYGIAFATRPSPPTLSEQAQDRLRRLLDDARRLAGDVGQGLSDQATRSGEQVRLRAQKTGRRLAHQAREVGERAQRGTQDLAVRASEQARRATEEATRRARQQSEEAVRGAREFGERLAGEAGEAAREKADALRDSVSSSDSGRSFTGTLLTVAGLTLGGYLASKARRWM